MDIKIYYNEVESYCALIGDIEGICAFGEGSTIAKALRNLANDIENSLLESSKFRAWWNGKEKNVVTKGGGTR